MTLLGTHKIKNTKTLALPPSTSIFVGSLRRSICCLQDLAELTALDDAWQRVLSGIEAALYRALPSAVVQPPLAATPGPGQQPQQHSGQQSGETTDTADAGAPVDDGVAAAAAADAPGDGATDSAASPAGDAVAATGEQAGADAGNGNAQPGAAGSQDGGACD